MSNLIIPFKHYKVTLIYPLCQPQNKKIWLFLCHPCSQFTYYFSCHSSLLVQLGMTPFIASLSFLNFIPCCMVPFLISTISCLWDSCSYCAFITLLSRSWLLTLVQIWSFFSCSIHRPKSNWTPPTTNNINTSPENQACFPTIYMPDISYVCFHIFFHCIFQYTIQRQILQMKVVHLSGIHMSICHIMHKCSVAQRSHDRLVTCCVCMPTWIMQNDWKVNI